MLAPVCFASRLHSTSIGKFFPRNHLRRDLFEIRIRTAVRPQDIRRAIAEERPCIVHFCGHGLEDGSLLLEDDGGNNKPVSAEGLASLFKLHADYVNCVLLNACYSAKPAHAINQHINYAIGMNQPIGDKAAIAFTQGFYDGLGYENSETQDVFQRAFDEALVAIQMEDASQEQIPVLKDKLSYTENFILETNTNIYIEQETSENIRFTTNSVIQLEFPNGSVPLNSPFYIEPDDIKSIYETLLTPGSLIRIKAPKFMGKTSLIIRLLAHAEKQQIQSVYLDLGGIDKAIITNLDKLLRWLCGRISDELEVENKVSSAWNTDILGSNDNCTDYFRKYILVKINSPLVLCLDEVDRLFPHSEVAEDFFGMLRSWHEKGRISDVWKQLHLVLAHSTEPYIRLDIHQSPFNAGRPVELEEFNQLKSQELVTKHGIQDGDAVLEQLRRMVGGHPYLLRLALYEIARGKVSLKNLLQSATTEAGIYSHHLRSLLGVLQKAPELQTCFDRVVNSNIGVELDSIQIYKLHSLGLVQKQDNHVIPRCQLYREYFRRVL
ncbi:hypothetical protein NIES2109_56940 (plasmid) [Nostoc sp. HK-01]|nr:hypothetical protein NIES2109_56940 [Nostoc sp. HK-01]